MTQKSPGFVFSDESKDYLTCKIQDLQFVDGRYKLQVYSCRHCKTVAFRHHIANCEDVLCHACYGQYYRRPCPVCQTVITASKQDDEFEKAVFQLKVACEFKKNGCQTVVHLGHLLLNDAFQHMKNVMQNLLTENERLKDAMEKIKERLKEEQSKQTTVTKALLSRISQLEAQNAKLTKGAKAKAIGETLPRDLQKEHNPSASVNTTFNWTISGVREKMRSCKTWRDSFAHSDQFFVPSLRLYVSATLERSCPETHMLLRVDYVSESSAGSSPFLHARKYALVNQSASARKQDVVLLDQPCFGHDFGETCFLYYDFFPIRLLQDSDEYVKDDKIIIQIVLEPIASMFKRVSSMDGTLLLKIDNYAKRKQDGIDGMSPSRLVSESFYTSTKGYRMDVEINLNGFRVNEEGIYIWPRFRIGEWDRLHAFPIKFNYKRFLMDQSDVQPKKDIVFEDIQQYKRYSEFDDFNDFIPCKSAETLPYLKDDTLLIKIVIQML